MVSSDEFLNLCDEVLSIFIENKQKAEPIFSEQSGLNTHTPFSNLSRPVSITEWNEILSKLESDGYIKPIPFSKEYLEMTVIHTATKLGMEFCWKGGYAQQQIDLANERKVKNKPNRLTVWSISIGIISILIMLILEYRQELIQLLNSILNYE